MGRILLTILSIGFFLFQLPAHAAEEPDVDTIKPAAEAGDADAQFALAEAYHKGEGVTQNNAEAAKWYEKSANRGNVDAQFALGFVYRGGDGIPMDKVTSYMWFELANEHGNVHAYELRNDVAWSMTEDQIQEARKKAKQWKPVKDEAPN